MEVSVLNRNGEDTGRKVALEVGHIVHGIPETEFYIRKNAEFFGCVTFIRKRKLIHFTGVSHRNEIGKLCF